jgi:hypothetical protein
MNWIAVLIPSLRTRMAKTLQLATELYTKTTWSYVKHGRGNIKVQRGRYYAKNRNIILEKAVCNVLISMPKLIRPHFMLLVPGTSQPVCIMCACIG